MVSSVPRWLSFFRESSTILEFRIRSSEAKDPKLSGPIRPVEDYGVVFLYLFFVFSGDLSHSGFSCFVLVESITILEF